VIDRERILAKLAELDGYLSELSQIAPPSFDDYVRSIEKRRACERLLQISVETVIDICAMLVQSLRLGLPAEKGSKARFWVGFGNFSRTGEL